MKGMIRLTKAGGGEILLARGAIASIASAGPNMQGIQAYVRTFDGCSYEVWESLSRIDEMLAEDESRGAAHG
ncbi:hypothetical protein D9M68_413950 [compost metagenome]